MGNVVTATYIEVLEGVRATIAAHAQAQDDGRTDDLVALYSADGVVNVPNLVTLEGETALREGFAGWKPQTPQRHMVTNTLLTDWSDDEATAVSDVAFVQKGDAGWAVQAAGRYHDTFVRQDGEWRIRRRDMDLIM